MSVFSELAQTNNRQEPAPSNSSTHAQPSAIPTDDAQAALQFCQALAALMAGPAATSVFAALGTTQGTSSQSQLPQPDISIVVPVFNELANLPTLVERLSAVLGNMQLSYELVFADDGSRDGSVAWLTEYARHESNVVVLELARNFGHQVAISAGLDYARGRAVIIMDADLQDPPEVLPQFIAKWQEGHDVVYAVREQRKEGWLKRAAYAAFYRLLQRVAHIEIPLDAGDFCIMDRRVVELMNAMPERNRFVRGIRSWVGLKQVGLAYERQARYAGKPKYTFRRLVYLALDGLVSFSYIPLRVITMMGFSISLLSILLAIFYSVKKLFYGLNPPGFATLVVSTFFLAGIQLIMMGVIGEYVGRIFEEVKQRPLYVLRRITTGHT